MALTSTPPSTAGELSPKGPRGRYAKSEQVQVRIVRAAAEVFGTIGFHASTFKEIARRAEVSERGLVYHFPTKEALLEAVMNDHHHRRSTVVLSATGLASFAAVLAVVEADAQMASVVGLQSILTGEATAHDHPAHEHYRLRYADLRTYLGRAFTAALNNGLVTSELDPTDLAAGLIALLDGLQMQWLYDHDGVRVGATIDGYLAALLSPEAMAEVRGHRRAFLDESISDTAAQ
ncbi:TetR/AcrR family transcriptional regulator [Arthrobacter sp. Rue61a]|uniref:TetR/AcrR family transcriptional regulator n=1 Tax=Arthrobacter sp. Rue61a TaxID=1118963 RepID=UPI00027DFDAD|nr:TetR/AcrR family transcriptional regulator [Arthrobacter sp. Rue61a]AFR28773.1 transcriptional regulator, TetR family [Arthrobacter sp. Rue61a]